MGGFVCIYIHRKIQVTFMSVLDAREDRILSNLRHFFRHVYRQTDNAYIPPDDRDVRTPPGKGENREGVLIVSVHSISI